MSNPVTIESSITDAVDALSGELFAFLQALVRIPTLPGQEAPGHTFVASRLRELGLDVRTLSATRDTITQHPAFCDDGLPIEPRINVVGRWRGRASAVVHSDSARSEAPGGGAGWQKNDAPPEGWVFNRGAAAAGTSASAPVARSLILNGHLDVVSPGNESRWTDSPWSGVIRDGRLYGRGSCDMKAGLSAAIFAIAALQRAGITLDGDVLLQSVSGEESGGLGTLTTIVEGYRADAAIILEPTSLRVCVVQSGALTFRLRVRGRSVHACMKPLGVSAIAKVPPLLDALEALERRRHASYQNPLYENPANIAPISVGTIQGGDWPSTVPEETVLEGRFGVMPGESLDDARRALAEAVKSAADADPWLKQHPPELEWFEGQFESGATDPEGPIVTALRTAHADVTGEAAVLQGVTYGSDMRLFTNHANMPAVLYGPGSIEQAHAVDEFVELRQVVEAVKILALTMNRWCGGSPA
jgi:acetylornithine deacetylase